MMTKAAYSDSVYDLKDPRYINLQCSYDFIRTKEFNEFVKEQLDAFVSLKNFEAYRTMKEEYRKYKWWEFWKKRFVLFSIDQVTGTIHGGYRQDESGMLAFPFESPSTTYSIDPTYIYIEIKVLGKVTDSFSIDRFSGYLLGMKYSESLTKEQGKLEYVIGGKCTPVKQIF